MEKLTKKDNIEGDNEPKIVTNQYWKKGIVIAIIIILLLVVLIFTMDVPTSSQDMGVGDKTQEELDELYPQVENADVPTSTTPEETYAKLKEALKNEDVDTAAEQFAEEVREEWRESLREIKEKGFMQEMEQDLTELQLEQKGDSLATYTFDHIDKEGDVVEHHISFVKDSNGDWKVESL